MTRRILHVVESYGGGVASAIDSYVDSVPELEHHIVYALRDGDYAPAGELERFTSAYALGNGFFGALRSIRAVVKNVEPDIVHAHSSFGGAYARLSVRSTVRRKVVYTPHCYAFERQDISKRTRAAYRLAERVFAWNTAVVAGCSIREVRLATALRRRVKTVHLPNVASDDVAPTVESSRTSHRALVAGVGRLGAQKDPEYFAAVVRAMRAKRPVDAIWIGDGDAALRGRLEADGIKVTGWLSRPRVYEELDRASVYVHSARWEGFPMAVLEAHRMGLPIVARAVGPLEDIAAELGSTEESSVGALAVATVEEPQRARRSREAWAEYLSENTRAGQRAVLLKLYEVVGG